MNKKTHNAAADVIAGLLTAAEMHQVCPACLAELCADIFLAGARQMPHIDEDEKFSIERLHIHDTAGNA